MNGFTPYAFNSTKVDMFGNPISTMGQIQSGWGSQTQQTNYTAPTYTQPTYTAPTPVYTPPAPTYTQPTQDQNAALQAQIAKNKADEDALNAKIQAQFQAAQQQISTSLAAFNQPQQQAQAQTQQMQTPQINITQQSTSPAQTQQAQNNPIFGAVRYLGW